MKRKSKKIIAIVLAAAAVTAAAATGIGLALTKKGPFTGTVKDSAGAPLTGVSVTDGRHVVKTAEDGSFTLAGWRKSSFVTVTVPAGYATDAFYLPVDRAKDTYDFVLVPDESTAQTEHLFLQVSDTEIGENGTGDWLEALKETIQELKPAFLIHTGDICYEAGLKKHIQEMNTQTMGCTVRYVIGNHDYVDGKYGEELYESIYGPVWYSFEVGNVHYVVTSFQNGSDYPSRYDSDDRWRWLENDLRNTDPNKTVVMFNHTKCPDDDFVLTFDNRELDLKQHNLAAWIYGHYHYNYIEEQDGVLNISTARPDCGGIDSSAAATRVVRVAADGSLSTELLYYGTDADTEPQNALWTAQLDGNALYCDLIKDGEQLYIGTIDDDFPRRCGVSCVSAQTGKVLWFYETENSIKNNLAADETAVYAMDAAGKVYALNKTDGTLLWRGDVNLTADVGTNGAICLSDGILYTGNPRHITAYRVSDGSIYWQVERSRGENSPAEFVVTGNKLLVSSHWDALVALDKDTGKELWKNDDGDIRFRSSTPAVIDEHTLLVCDSSAMMVVNSDTGEITAKTTMEDVGFSSSAQPCIQGEVAYIPTANRGLLAFNWKTGETLWRTEVGEAKRFTPPYIGKGAQIIEATPVLLPDQTLIQPANDGKIYHINAQTGEILATYDAGSAILGKAAVTDTHIYAATFPGQLVCFAREDA